MTEITSYLSKKNLENSSEDSIGGCRFFWVFQIDTAINYLKTMEKQKSKFTKR